MSFIDGDYRDYMRKGMMHDRFANEVDDEDTSCCCDKPKMKKKIYSDGRGGVYEVEEQEKSPTSWQESVYG